MLSTIPVNLAKVSKQYNWGKSERLLDHFQRHGQDLAAKDPADYAKKTQEFYFQTKKTNLHST